MRTNNRLFVFCLWVFLHISYGQRQVVLVTELTNSVSLFEGPSNFTKLWDSNAEATNEFILTSSSYSIQISKNNQKINIETNRIDFPSFSLETENCVIIIDGYNEILDILQYNQQIISENTEEITIQDKTFQLFETTNLTIGFDVNKINKKSIVPKVDPSCCNIISNTSIFLSENCTCENPMTIHGDSITITWSLGDPIRSFSAPSITLHSNGSSTLYFTEHAMFEADTLLAISNKDINIQNPILSVSNITMTGTRIYSNNTYSSDVSSLTLIGSENGVYFCGNVANSTDLNLFGTSNSLKGVELCINDNQSTTMIMKNLYIEGISNTRAGVSIEKRFVCTENACDITGKSIDDYGVYLYTSKISNVKINGTSEQSNGIYFLTRTTDSGSNFYEEIELIGSGIIGVEIWLQEQTIFDYLNITGTSLSNTDGIKISPNNQQLQTTGNFESINGSINLPNFLNISSGIYPDSLTLKSDNEIFFDSSGTQISIFLEPFGIFDIVNGYLRTGNKLVINCFGIFGVLSQCTINIPNGGEIEGDLIFNLLGVTTIGNGIEVNGALQWNNLPFSTAILCGDIVATGSIILPFNTITACSTTNQLNITNTDTISINKLDADEDLIKPLVIISANNINLENKVNNLSKFLFFSNSFNFIIKIDWND